MPDWTPEIRPRLPNLQLPPTREAAIVEELAQHLDDCSAELLVGGATTDEAYRAALAGVVSAHNSSFWRGPTFTVHLPFVASGAITEMTTW